MKTIRKEHFAYATYRKIKGCCSSHQIRNVVVEELLLDGIRNITAFTKEYEDEFIVEDNRQNPRRGQ